jgi:hypothetical protein
MMMKIRQLHPKKVNTFPSLAKLEWLHYAVQEAMNGNLDELEPALELIEYWREDFINE